MTQTAVKDYYTGYVRKEWRRLVRDAYHRLEFETTLHFMAKHFPKRGLLLDAGGGPGRYTVELARRGYDMVLLDLTPANLEFAARQIKRARLGDRVKDVVEGSIVDLRRFPEGTFDGVVCLGGPLSHVLDECDRAWAIAELARVAKPGAPIAVSVMSRLSVLVVELVQYPHEIEMPYFKRLRDSGDYRGGYGFTQCHFFLPEELRAAFTAQGLEVLEMAGLEGLSAHHNKQLNAVARNPKRWKNWLETHYRTCTYPAVVATSEHMLIVCRKP